MIKIKVKVKNNIIRIIYFILILVWMYIVFGFSSQNGDESGSISRKLVELLFNWVEDKSLMEHIVRKCAHFSLYAAGGLIIYGFINTYKLSNKKKILITIIVGALYAISDEIHQIFVVGRSGQVSDILVDTSGIIFMMIVLVLRNRLSKKVKDIIYTFFLVVLIFAWMYVVFSFSNQDNTKSQKISTAATQIVVKEVTQENTSTNNKTVKDLNPIIRKCAHFTIYAIGGVLLYCLLDRSSLKVRYKVIIALALGVLYAITDETHQYYISGRTANLFDIWIDSLGVAFGIAFKIQVIDRVKKFLEIESNND